MYNYIIGTVSRVTPKYIVLENNGVGFEIIVSNPYSFVSQENIKVFVYQHIREECNDLYGFKVEEEKLLFLSLLSVNGIGPKSALSILASATVNEIVKAIEDRNDAYLRKFPGIGQKASQQIILDLKGKINFVDSTIMSTNTKLVDVGDALAALGYNKKEISRVVSKLDSSQETSVLVKEALKQMNK